MLGNYLDECDEYTEDTKGKMIGGFSGDCSENMITEQEMVEQQHTKGGYLIRCPGCGRELYHQKEMIWYSPIGLCIECEYKRRKNG